MTGHSGRGGSREASLLGPEADLRTASDHLFAAAVALISVELCTPLQAWDDLLPVGTRVVALWDIGLEPKERQGRRVEDSRRDLVGPTAAAEDRIPAGTRALIVESHRSSKSAYYILRPLDSPLAGVDLFAYRATAWWAWVQLNEPVVADRPRAERLLDNLRALERGWSDEQLDRIGWRLQAGL